MRRYKVGDLALMLGTSVKICSDLSTSDKLKQPIVDDEFCEAFVQIVDGLLIVSRNFDADPALISAIESLLSDAKRPDFDRREAVLYARLHPIVDGIQNNLNLRAFMYIPADRADYWENGELFGRDFLSGFPKAATLELLEAVDCYAAGRWTACVFHSIRIAEFGLRVLARHMKVLLSDKGKRQPLEYADWNKIITSARNRIIETQKKPHGPKKAKELQFYSSVADQCEYMKDIWRNEIMHTRRLYNQEEGLAVLTRVRDFAQLLAPIEAKKRTKQTASALRRFVKLRMEHAKGNLDPWLQMPGIGAKGTLSELLGKKEEDK